MHRFFDKQTSKHRVILDPGEIYVTDADECIYTVLGSCVAVCLYDRVSGIGGMNHFILAKRTHVKGISNPPIGRYGEDAMTELFDQFNKMGGDIARATARVFGGASSVSRCCKVNCLSKENAMYAHEYLKKKGVIISGADTGGAVARRVFFNVETGDVKVLTVKRKGFDSCTTVSFDDEPPDMRNHCCHNIRLMKRST